MSIEKGFSSEDWANEPKKEKTNIKTKKDFIIKRFRQLAAAQQAAGVKMLKPSVKAFSKDFILKIYNAAPMHSGV